MFSVLFNFIINTAVAYVLKMGHHVPVCRITGQARAPSLSNDTHNTKGFGFSEPRLEQNMLKPGFVV